MIKISEFPEDVKTVTNNWSAKKKNQQSKTCHNTQPALNLQITATKNYPYHINP
jgi:hypothetical protein